MRVNQEGLDLIKRFESLRLKSYLCPAGVWTIGYGHTRGVTPGIVITEAEAERLLREDIEPCERAVSSACKVPLTSAQFSALVSLVFNIGAGAFSKSTLLKLLNQGQYSEAEKQFKRWNKAGGRELPGLTRRRAAEAELFNKESK